VRSVTEVRMEAARHANPLTFLPGQHPDQPARQAPVGQRRGVHGLLSGHEQLQAVQRPLWFIGRETR